MTSLFRTQSHMLPTDTHDRITHTRWLATSLAAVYCGIINVGCYKRQHSNMLSLYRLWVFITPTCQCCTYGPTHKAAGVDVIVNETWKPTVPQIVNIHSYTDCCFVPLLCLVCHRMEKTTRKSSKGEILTFYSSPNIMLGLSNPEGSQWCFVQPTSWKSRSAYSIS